MPRPYDPEPSGLPDEHPQVEPALGRGEEAAHPAEQFLGPVHHGLAVAVPVVEFLQFSERPDGCP